MTTYKHHYIYKITCLCGTWKGYYYIGKHSTLKEDAELDGYYGGGVLIRKYYKKYPPVFGKTITKEILEYNTTKEENSIREKEIIGDLYLSDSKCLNMKKGGEGGNGHANKGKKHSNEQTENHIAYMKEYWKTHKPPKKGKGKVVECYDDDGELVARFVTKEAAGKFFGGHPISHGLEKPTNKQFGFRWKLVDGMFAPITNIEPYKKPKKTMPKEAVEKIAAKKRGIEMPWEWVPVIATDKEGNETEYNSIRLAAEIVHQENTKAAQKNIQQAASGKRNTAYGYTWRYVKAS